MLTRKIATILIVVILLVGCASSKKIYILGSFHNLDSVKDSKSQFKNILHTLNPDFIFIESPTSWFTDTFSLKLKHAVYMSKKKMVHAEKLFNPLDFEGSDFAEIKRL